MPCMRGRVWRRRAMEECVRCAACTHIIYASVVVIWQGEIVKNGLYDYPFPSCVWSVRTPGVVVLVGISSTMWTFFTPGIWVDV